MADQENDPHDEKVRTVPLPSDEAGDDDDVIAQENQGPEVAVGGGEWPSPDEPPTGPAGGRREGPAGRPFSGEPPAAEDDDDGSFPPMRGVLEADPVAGGSQSTPDGDGGDDAAKLR